MSRFAPSLVTGRAEPRKSNIRETYSGSRSRSFCAVKGRQRFGKRGLGQARRIAAAASGYPSAEVAVVPMHSDEIARTATRTLLVGIDTFELHPWHRRPRAHRIGTVENKTVRTLALNDERTMTAFSCRAARTPWRSVLRRLNRSPQRCCLGRVIGARSA